MKNKLLKLTVLAVAAMSVTPAFAASSASASLNDLTVTLYSLNGGPISFSWNNTSNNSFVDSYTYDSGSNTNQSNNLFSTTPNAPVSVSVGGAILGASAAITNSTGTPVTSSFTSSGQALGYTYFSADSYIHGNSFTIGANTMAVFSATATANANITIGTNLNGSESADSYAKLSTYGSYTSSGGTLYNISNDAALYADVSNTAQGVNNADTLSLSFTNLSNSSITGAISASTSAYGQSVSAVPEPGEWALLMSGLGLMGFVATRRPKTAV